MLLRWLRRRWEVARLANAGACASREPGDEAQFNRYSPGAVLRRMGASGEASARSAETMLEIDKFRLNETMLHGRRAAAARTQGASRSAGHATVEVVCLASHLERAGAKDHNYLQ